MQLVHLLPRTKTMAAMQAFWCVGCRETLIWKGEAASSRPALASGRERLAEPPVFCESDVTFEVVRTRSVHEGGYGHNRVGAAA